jgi:hypothetical protein
MGTPGALSRPIAVHRLDKPTSGCLVVAKTKPALVNLGRQFHDRSVSKLYTAIVNGKLPRPSGSLDGNNPDSWSVIEEPLEGKEAVTHWRVLFESPCAFAVDETLSWVQLRPRTGRFHQLRQHMSTVLGRPIAGDDRYDGNSPNARRLRERGLCLSATQITLRHPWYNTPAGRREYYDRHGSDQVRRNEDGGKSRNESFGYVWLDEVVSNGGNGTVMITAEVAIPSKFYGLVSHEQQRYFKFLRCQDELK